MRTIKFRGKRADNGEWVYGDLLRLGGGCIIYFGSKTETQTPDIPNSSPVAVELFYDEIAVVIPDTVGQFTGLTDCNDKEIYEGDILVYGGQCKHVVEFKHGMSGYELADGWFVGYGGNSNFTFNPFDKSKEHEVIGNIHDNPGLMKGGKK